MRVTSRLFKTSLWLASTSLCLSTPLALAPAFAQDAGNGDPPALVGRLASVHGSVSFHTVDETQWSPATLNYPVSTGNSFWTEPQASATIEIADTLVALDGGTELDVGALDQTQMVTTEAQGAIYLHFASLPQGQQVTVNTPRGAVQIEAPGRYEIVAGTTDQPTFVTVVEGQARVTGDNLSLDIGAQQTATIQGADNFQGQVGPEQNDDFLNRMLARASQAQTVSLPAPVRHMTGTEELAGYGQWQSEPQYGQVWYPQVASDWQPYHDGHWSYVAPWGWTWVDNAPWGFAPFHYGRWVQVGPRWGWVAVSQEAQSDPYPVYAPAEVSFVDVGGAALAGAAIGFAAGAAFASGSVGWVPLGPGEPYVPPYQVSNDYFRQVNNTYVSRTVINNINVTNINNTNVTRTVYNNRFVNARAATVVPASAMVRAESIRGVARPLPPAALLAARPAVFRTPVAPTAQTPHVTRAVARQYNFAPPARPVARAAAGPAIVARPPAGAAGGPAVGSPAARVPLAAHVPPGVPRRAMVPAAGGAAMPAAPAGRITPAPGTPTQGVANPRPSGLPGLRPVPGHGVPGGPPPIKPHTGMMPAPAARPGLPPRPMTGGATAGRPTAGGPSAGGPSAGGPSAGGPTAGRPMNGARPALAAPHSAAPLSGAPATPHPAYTPPPRPQPVPRVERPAPVPRVPHTAPAPVARPERLAPAPLARPTSAPRPPYQAPAPRPQFQAPAPRPQFQAPAPRPQFQAPPPRAAEPPPPRQAPPPPPPARPGPPGPHKPGQPQ